MKLDNYKLVKKSKLAPVGLKVTSGHYVIGDVYKKSMLVTALPRVFDAGMLSMYTSNPSIKVYMSSHKMTLNCAALLKKEYNEKKREWQNSSADPSKRQRLEDELTSLNTYIQEIIKNGDVTHNVVIIFTVQADNIKDLNSRANELKLRLQSDGFKVMSGNLMQENLLRVSTPVFMDSRLPSIIEQNIGIPLPSLGLAGTWPFVFETMKDPDGFILGHETGNNGIICFDPYFYRSNKQQAVIEKRMNGNMIVVGASGAGKTTTMDLIVRYLIRKKKKIIWIDPENKNQYMTKKYGGTYINWGRKNNIINIFDLKPISVEDDEDPNIMWDTETAIYNVVDDIKITLRYLTPSISDDTLNIIGDITKLTYEKAGIDLHGSFKGLTYEDFPTFSDFDKMLDKQIKSEEKRKKPVLKRIELLEDLKLKITPLLNEWSMYFNGHTTVNLMDNDRPIISFGTKILYNKSTQLKNALNRIMYQFAWSLCLDDSEDSAFLFDEAHTQIHDVVSAELIAQFTRRSRKYRNISIIGTQEPKDFAVKEVLVHGKSIFNSSTYKLIMSLEHDAVEDLRKLCTLNNNECNLIEQFRQGDALLIAGNRRIPMQVIATDNELSEMGSKV